MSEDYCYTDKAIWLLNQLNRSTQKMCFGNFSILLDDNSMKKRVVTIKHRDKTILKDPRLAYFKLRVIMNRDFDSIIFEKFIKFFDDLKKEEYWLNKKFSKLALSK